MRSVIIGGGRYGEVYLSYLKEDGVEIVGFLDDDINHSKLLNGIPLLGTTDLLPDLKSKFDVDAIYCPLGNNRIRVDFLRYARELGYKTPNYIHPTAYISPNVEIGNEGIYILGNTYVMPHVTIDKDVMISVGANIIHHTHLKQGVFISNGVNLGASLVADECAYLGMGSTIMTGVTRLGKDSLIGAGAVVIKDVPDGAVVAGIPAKIIKYKPEYRSEEES